LVDASVGIDLAVALGAEKRRVVSVIRVQNDIGQIAVRYTPRLAVAGASGGTTTGVKAVAVVPPVGAAVKLTVGLRCNQNHRR